MSVFLELAQQAAYSLEKCPQSRVQFANRGRPNSLHLSLESLIVEELQAELAEPESETSSTGVLDCTPWNRKSNATLGLKP